MDLRVQMQMKTTHFWRGVIHATHFVERHNEEAAAAADLDHDGQELGVDGAEVWVVRVPRDLDVVEAPLPLARRAVHVTELGAPDPAEIHPVHGLLALARVKHISILNIFSSRNESQLFLFREM